MNRFTSVVSNLLLILISGFTGTAFSQSYYYQLAYGPETAYYWGTTGTTVLSSSPVFQNDVLSSPVALPFTWNFYGAVVTHYLVSDNGYITFDTTAPSSIAANTTLPNLAAPRSAIFAFWDNFALDSYSGVHDVIVRWTYGSAPNRVHVIQWQSVTPYGNSPSSNYVAMAIRIFESGDFDVVHNLAKSIATLSGTVGVQDAAGADGTMEVSSPGHTFPTVFPVAQTDMRVYKFIYGTAPAYDLAGIEHGIPDLVATGTSVNVTGSFLSYGTDTVQTLNLVYQVDGGTPVIETVSGLSIPVNGTYNFTHGTPWIASAVDSFHTFKIWTDNINGNADQVNSNDTIFHQAFVNLGISATRHVLLEEFSTAPCGWCPRGHLLLDSLLGAFPNLLGFTHHSGYLSDDMTIPESVTIADQFALGAPSGTVDRVWWDGELQAGVGTGKWLGHIQERFATPSPVELALSASWDASSRDLDISLGIDFIDYPYPGDIRISVFVIEDHVTGTGSGYDQTNYYNTDPTHPYYNLGNPITGYDHRHVVRDMTTPTWGESGIIISNPGPADLYNRSYTYNIPQSFKETDISVIAAVSYYDGDLTEVLNAAGVSQITGKAANAENGALVVYPNPASDAVFIRFADDGNSIQKILLRDAFGKINCEIPSNGNEIAIRRNELPAGIYFIEVTGNERLIRKFVFE